AQAILAEHSALCDRIRRHHLVAPSTRQDVDVAGAVEHRGRLVEVRRKADAVPIAHGTGATSKAQRWRHRQIATRVSAETTCWKAEPQRTRDAKVDDRDRVDRTAEAQRGVRPAKLLWYLAATASSQPLAESGAG